MRGFRVGSAFGIPVRLNWTFLIVLPLFAVFIAWDIAELVVVINETLGATMDPDQLTEGNLSWLLGLASALGLFSCVLLHEFGHSVAALRYGYEIDSITLWLLGGVANFTEFPENWRHELVLFDLLFDRQAVWIWIIVHSGNDIEEVPLERCQIIHHADNKIRETV